METPERAGVVSRFAAFFVDAVILAVVFRTTLWLLRALTRVLGSFAPPVSFKALLVASVPLLVALYDVAFWSTLGQTPGKWLLGIKIVPLEGGRLKVSRAVLRLVGYLVSALPFYLGFVAILGTQRLGWHDRLARTEVTYVRARAPKDTPVSALRERIREQHDAPGVPRLPGPT